MVQAGKLTRVCIHYDVGWENRITLRGDGGPFNWERGLPCHSVDAGTWVYEWEMEQESISFKPLINDEQWSIGVDYHIRRGETRNVYPFFHDDQGRLETVHHFDTPISIFLPPGYDENPTRRYPVCYIHDGQNLFDPQTAFMGQIWGLHETMTRLVRSGLMEPVIGVGIYNRGAARIHDYTPSFDPNFGEDGAGGGADSYNELVVEEIKPFVDLKYRTRTGPGDTGLLGSSLGGLVSLYMARTRPDIFGKVASLSSSFWWNRRNLIRQVIRSREHIPIKIYLDAGGQESWEETLAMYQALLSCGYVAGKDLYCYIAPNHGHTESAWGSRAHLPLTFLYPPQHTAVPGGHVEKWFQPVHA
ncbi:MAG: alpha/beta hydrolase-fold protein [Acidobacteriota bacterium]|nr:alpha/beta hydrolase-fold protein [Acidobacteriota bacterium]